MQITPKVLVINKDDTECNGTAHTKCPAGKYTSAVGTEEPACTACAAGKWNGEMCPVEEIERAERGFMTSLSCGRRSSQIRNSTFFLVAAVPATRPATNSIAIEPFITGKINEKNQFI